MRTAKLRLMSLILLLTAAPVGIFFVGDVTAQEGSYARERMTRPPAGQFAKATVNAPKTVLGFGDRLKITFFEMFDVGGNPAEGGGASAVLQTFYQRMDLSGEYAVDQEGAISFPRLGRFQVQGRGLHDLQSELAAAFVKVMGRPADVNVTIMDQSPVYVVGPVKNPGAYKHVPGMMVLHALALAGGLDQGLGSVSQVIEGVREMERMRKAADQMERLHARRARLDAERNGIDPQQPSQLISLAGERGARALLATEMAILRVEQARQQHQQSELAAAAQAARNELKALNNKLGQLNVQESIRTERLKDLQKLMNNGHTTRNTVITVLAELSDIEMRRQDLLLALTQAEARLAQAEQARTRLSLDNAANLMKEIAVTDQEITEVQQSLSSSEILAAFMEESNAKLMSTKSPATPAYEIVRQGARGPVVVPAQETTSLMPGDVLKVGLKSSSPPKLTNRDSPRQFGFERGSSTPK